jgi:hypothetical protein
MLIIHRKYFPPRTNKYICNFLISLLTSSITDSRYGFSPIDPLR